MIVCLQFRTTHAILLGGGHSRQIENLPELRGILDLNRFLRVLRSRTSKLFRHGRSVSGLACTVCCERHCTGIVLALYGARPTVPHSGARFLIEILTLGLFFPQRFLPRRIVKNFLQNGTFQLLHAFQARPDLRRVLGGGPRPQRQWPLWKRAYVLD